MAQRYSNNQSDPGTVYLLDHCETMTARDTGRNIAEHDLSAELGFEDLYEFGEICEEFDAEGLRPADALVHTVAQEAEDLERVRNIANKAQEDYLDHYGDGFLHLSEYRDQPLTVVTAGLEEPPRYALEKLLGEDAPQVYGARVKQNGSGLEVDRYCSGPKKLEVIHDELGFKPTEITSIAFGNSPNDANMMNSSEEAFGRDRAREFSTLYFEDDIQGWGRATAGITAEQLLEGKTIEEAQETAFDFLETGREEYGYFKLEEPEIVNQGPVTEDIDRIYSRAKQEYSPVKVYGDD